MAQSNNITIKFKSQGAKSLRTALKNLAKAQEQLVGASKKVAAASGKTEKAGNKLIKNNRLLGNSFATLRSHMLLYSFAMSMGIRQMLEMVQHSAKVDAMRLSFSNLADSANLGFNTLEKLREATNNTASDFDLLAQANNALLLGVADNSDQMAEMFDVAQRLGRALGKDAASSVESLITGIGRQSRLMLDNLGIVVKTEEAYKNYAKELGVSVENLTDAEKKTAFLNAAMDAAQEKVKNLGAEQLTATDHFGAFSTAISNAMDVIGKKLAPTFALAAKEYGEFIADVIGSNPEIVKYTSEISAMDRNLVKLKSDSALLTEVINKQSTTYKDYFDNVKRLNPELKNSGEVEEMLNARITLLNKQIEILIKHIEKEKEAYLNSLGVKKETTESTKELTKETAKLAELKLQEKHLEDGIISSAERRAEINLELQNATELKALGLITENELLSLNLKLQKEGIKLGDVEQKMASDKIKLGGKTINTIAAIAGMNSKNAKEVAKLQAIASGVNAFAAASDAFAQAAKNPLTIANPMYPNIIYGLTLAQGLAGAVAAHNAASKMEQGGLVGGRRHSQGGTIIEAEQGEFIMSRNAVDAVGVEAMNRINAGGGGSVNISFEGNVMSQDFIEDEAIPMIKEAIRRGADIGVA